ncbi:MAG: glycosyltransferase family 29 protein [bacterium]
MNSEERLKKFIENKKIIFVGPARIIKDKNLGKWIDDFDIVVRTNGAINLLDNENYKKDYGSRCDILCVNVQFHRETKMNLPLWKEKYGLKFFGMKTSPVIMKEYNKIVPTFTLSSSISEVSSKVQGALYGPIVMHHLLKFNPKEMWFTGLDFYYTKPDVFIPNDYREYFPGYLPKVIEEKANTANIGRIDPHDQYSNTKFISELVNSGKVQTHDFIKEIMNTIINNREYYTYDAKVKRVKEGK